MGSYRSMGGFIRVELTSGDILSALRCLMENQITCFRTEEKGELSAIFSIHRRDYPKLRSIVEKRGDTLNILKHEGRYWLFRSLWKRPVLVGGLLLLLMAALYLPSRVFFVRVEGNREIPANLILEAGEECGIRFGASRRDVRSERVKNALLEAVPALKWAGVNTYGCVAVISVREREIPHASTPGSAYGNIIAVQDGLITSCTATKGNLLCEPGQAVTQGQILISGYTDCGICIRAEQAQGEVFANTRRELSVIIPSQYRSRVEKQEEIRYCSILIGKKRIKLWKDSGISDASCGRMYEEYYMTLPGGFQLPIALAVDTYTVWSSSDTVLMPQHAEARLTAFAHQYLKDRMLAGQIHSERTSIFESDGCFCLDGQYVCNEMIGVMQRKEIGVENEQTG